MARLLSTLAFVPALALAASPRAEAPVVRDMPWPVWTPAIPAVPPSATGTTWYVDGARGSDRNDGRAPGEALATIAAAVRLVGAGDTVLIRGGLYREGINLRNRASGAPGRPITFGSFGDGEVILDGSTRVAPWTRVAATVWRAPVAFAPVAVVVDEVPLRQVRQGQRNSTAPPEGEAGVVPGSGKWFAGDGYVVADMGAAIGERDPNEADIVVPRDDRQQEHVFWYGGEHYRFVGLTVRGSGSNGIWGYGRHVTVEGCNVKFNVRAAVSFQPGGPLGTASDNAVIATRAYHNVLVNWPRGNNGFAEAGGGWPGALAWASNLRPLARGNVVHMNGGEGILSYGTRAGQPSGEALVERNVVFDNWSVNIYFDNQPGNVARDNFVFNRPPDDRNFLHVGPGRYESLDKYGICVMLANEQGSSDATSGHANLRGTKVYNNVLAGCRIGVRDYAEGMKARLNHGLKDTLIANNTIVVSAHRYRNAESAGIVLSDNGLRDEGTVIANNVVVALDASPLVVRTGAALRGIEMDRNVYHSPSARPFRLGTAAVDFAGWRSANAPDEAKSVFADPLLADARAFTRAQAAPYDFALARPRAGSPAAGTGPGQPFMPPADFLGRPRTSWRAGAL